MVSLEQIKLLESRITKAIDHVKRVTEENSIIKGKLDSYQKRIEELEILIQQFKEEQSRIEEGILSALDRLNQFEDAIEQSLTEEKKDSLRAAPKPAKSEPLESSAPAAVIPPIGDAIEEATEVLPLADEDEVSEDTRELDIF
jgi:chromosome segregation ATPase